MGTALAIREHTTPVPGTPTGPELNRALREYVKKLDAPKKLKSYGAALETVNRGSIRGAHYYLLALDPGEEKVWVAPYPKNMLERATSDYLAVERAMNTRAGAEAVLVSVESIATLRRAYPNYFLDTRLFIDAVNNALAM